MVFMRVLLQFPEGLKQHALEYAKRLEAEGSEVFVSASPTFGACDLAIDEARNIGADKLIHYGHAEFKKVDFNVEYVEFFIDAPLDILEDSLAHLKDYRTIGIVTTIQQIRQLDAIREFYEKSGKSVVIGKPYGLAKLPGQVLGCDAGSAASIDSKVDCHVYFGGGVFHPLGALLSTTKPLIAVDPFNSRIERMDRLREEYRKRSRGKVMSALDAGSFGILVSTKNGQRNMDLGRILKERVEGEGLKAAILVANTFDFESLSNMMEFDAFVNTACPRIAMDDTERIGKPLLSANELMEVLKMKEELKTIRKRKKN
jgi:2-(3-amino-3-carboxypropyl)histidine synthase